MKGGIAAAVAAGVEVGEAINHLGVGRRIVEQDGAAEIKAAAPGEYFVAYIAGEPVGIGAFPSVLFGKFDTDLHRPGGVHRVGIGQHFLAERQLGDHVVEQRVELLFGFQGVDTLLVTAAVR